MQSMQMLVYQPFDDILDHLVHVSFRKHFDLEHRTVSSEQQTYKPHPTLSLLGRPWSQHIFASDIVSWRCGAAQCTLYFVHYLHRRCVLVLVWCWYQVKRNFVHGQFSKSQTRTYVFILFIKAYFVSSLFLRVLLLHTVVDVAVDFNFSIHPLQRCNRDTKRQHLLNAANEMS